MTLNFLQALFPPWCDHICHYTRSAKVLRPVKCDNMSDCSTAPCFHSNWRRTGRETLTENECLKLFSSSLHEERAFLLSVNWAELLLKCWRAKGWKNWGQDEDLNQQYCKLWFALSVWSSTRSILRLLMYWLYWFSRIWHFTPVQYSNHFARLVLCTWRSFQFYLSCPSNAACLICFCLFRKLGYSLGMVMYDITEMGWAKGRAVEKKRGM